MDPKTMKFVTSRDVVFDKVSSWYFAKKLVVDFDDDQDNFEYFPQTKIQASCNGDPSCKKSEGSPRLKTSSLEGGE